MAAEFVRGEALREGREDGGVPFGFGQQLRPYGRVHDRTGEVVEQGGRRAVVEGAESDQGQSREVGIVRPVFRHREQEPDRAVRVGVPRCRAEDGS